MPEAIYRSSTSNNLLSMLFILFPYKKYFHTPQKNQNITLTLQRYKKNRYRHLILLNIFRNLILSFTPQQPSPYLRARKQSLPHLPLAKSTKFGHSPNISNSSKYHFLNQLIQKPLRFRFSEKHNLCRATIAKRCFFCNFAVKLRNYYLLTTKYFINRYLYKLPFRYYKKICNKK